MPQQEQAHGGRHDLILENRNRLTATGVTKIISYDEGGAVLETQQGTLTIVGREISVNTLSIETGEVKIEGCVQEISYAENRQSGGGLFRRLMR